MTVEVSEMYLDAVAQVLEQLINEVDDDAVPVDAGAVLEETKQYLVGDQDASQEEVAEPAVEEASAEEAEPAELEASVE